MSQKQQYDLKMPLNSSNKFLQFLLRNKDLNKVAYKQVIACFALGFILFLTLAIYQFVAMGSVYTISQNYFYIGSTQCLPTTQCTVTFTTTQTMKFPIYLLYQLEGFYQNHRRYISSKSNAQLSGKVVDFTSAKTCSPFLTNAKMKVTHSWKGVPLDPNALASPCGDIAYTYFNDTYALYFNGVQIPIDETGISWPGDKGGKYRRAENSNESQWIDPQNEHFINWMRASGLPNFKKVWGKIYQNLPAGKYQMVIQNNYNLQEWLGPKNFILTTNSSAGAKNYLLPIFFILAAIFSLVAGIILLKKVGPYRRALQQLH